MIYSIYMLLDNIFRKPNKFEETVYKAMLDDSIEKVYTSGWYGGSTYCTHNYTTMPTQIEFKLDGHLISLLHFDPCLMPNKFLHIYLNGTRIEDSESFRISAELRRMLKNHQTNTKLKYDKELQEMIERVTNE